MSDRIKGLTVALQADMRDDDAQAIIDAILLIRGVIAVKPHVANPDHYFAVTAAKRDMQERIRAIVWD